MPAYLQQIGAVIYGLSVLLVLLLMVRAVWFYRRSRGRTPTVIELSYRRAPWLAACMALSLGAAIAFPSLTTHIVIGVLWGVTVPIRFVLRFWWVHREDMSGPGWHYLRWPRGWWVMLQCILVHGVAWPLSVPILHWYGTRSLYRER